MITRDEVLMGREKTSPLTPEMELNLQALLIGLNKFRTIYGKPMKVASGYRPPEINSKIKGAAKKSNHMVCLACDFVDIDGSLDLYCANNLKILEECGLYLEHPKWTKTWCHLQVAKPSSGKRIFIPFAGEPLPGKCDKLFLNLKI